MRRSSIAGVMPLLLVSCGLVPTLAHAQDYPLTDTGITWSGSYPTGNATECEPSHPTWQDCRYGLDAAAAAGALAKLGGSTPNHGVPNGFDYTKISNSGNLLDASAMLGSGPDDWACTFDNVTGLMWEVKTDDAGLRDQDWTYTWYNPASPDGNPGTEGDTLDCNGSLGGLLCNTENYANAVNAADLCGHDDWRMPSLQDLLSIVDYGREFAVGPIDPEYFPNTPAVNFWSGSPYAGDSTNAWFVYMYGGGFRHGKRYFDSQVRLVRGGL